MMGLDQCYYKSEVKRTELEKLDTSAPNKRIDLLNCVFYFIVGICRLDAQFKD